jgi:hypothetical protein
VTITTAGRDGVHIVTNDTDAEGRPVGRRKPDGWTQGNMVTTRETTVFGTVSAYEPESPSRSMTTEEGHLHHDRHFAGSEPIWIGRRSLYTVRPLRAMAGRQANHRDDENPPDQQ